MKKTLLFLSICICFFSCANKSTNYISIGGFTQGTTYNIVYEGDNNINFQDEIEVLLAKFDSSLSAYNKSSVISKINTNQSLVMDDYLKVVFKKAYEIYDQTNGAFDITVAPFVNLWGFGFTNREEVTNAKIDSILEFAGLSNVEITDSMIIKSDPRIMFDVNGIAQGYSVDIVTGFLEEKEIQNYLVEIGGEVKTKGINSKGKAWKIGIDKPVDNNLIPGENLQAIVELSDKSLATSGNYRKFYENEGVKYSHTINPTTGYPVNHTLLSVSVIANDCMTADAYATAFLVMGMDESIELIKKINDIEAFFIFSDENGRYQVKGTPEMQKLIIEIK